jgi:hypothetical protein
LAFSDEGYSRRTLTNTPVPLFLCGQYKNNTVCKFYDSIHAAENTCLLPRPESDFGVQSVYL